TVTLTVTDTPPVNTAPTADDLVLSTPQGTPLNGLFVGVDVDGDALTFSIVVGPAHGTLLLDAVGGFRYLPSAGFHGSDSFTYVANDGSLDSNAATVALTVIDTTPPTLS